MAQRLNVPATSFAVPNQSIGLQTSGTIVPTRIERVDSGHQIWLDDSSDQLFRPLTDLIDRLPLHRLENMVKANPKLRYTTTAVGIALVGVERLQGSAPSYITVTGVQALRLGAGTVFTFKGFHIEPSMRDGGFAVYLRKAT